MRAIPLKINNKNIIIQKTKYIKDEEILAIEDIVKNNIELPIEKKINLENISDCFFSIIYKRDSNYH